MAARTRRAAVAATARPAPAPAWWTRPWVPAAGLALLCLVVYGNSFGVGFALDNRQLVLRDPRVHTANVLLFWRVSRRITGDRWAAVAAAALWAVLPLSTEAVTNIVGRADLLAATG